MTMTTTMTFTKVKLGTVFAPTRSKRKNKYEKCYIKLSIFCIKITYLRDFKNPAE